MSERDSRSPAQVAMDEAIDLAVHGRSPYPERASFIDAEAPYLADAIARAADDGRAVVLCYMDGSRRISGASAARGHRLSAAHSVLVEQPFAVDDRALTTAASLVAA